MSQMNTRAVADATLSVSLLRQKEFPMPARRDIVLGTGHSADSSLHVLVTATPPALEKEGDRT
jgi:hypothetical protein